MRWGNHNHQLSGPVLTLAEHQPLGDGGMHGSHSPSCGRERSGGPGGGSRWLFSLDLSLSSRGLPCWKGPTTSDSAKQW